jgi:hypothetical protein
MAADGGVVWPVVGPVLAATGLLGYFVMGSELVPMTVSQRNLVATVLASCLVLGLYTGSASLLSRAFSLPWMTWMGKISYGIYLWHWPAILLLQRIFDVRPLLIALMAGVLATALASLSYQLVETPIRRGRVLDPFPWRVVGAGLSVSVVVALVVVPPVLNSSRTPAMVNGNLTEAIAAQTLADGEEVEIDLEPFLDAGQLLYGGPWIAAAQSVGERAPFTQHRYGAEADCGGGSWEATPRSSFALDQPRSWWCRLEIPVMQEPWSPVERRHEPCLTTL